MAPFPKIKQRVITIFPARVEGRKYITVEKSNGIYYFDFDASDIGTVPDVPDDDKAQTYVLVWDKLTDAPLLVEYNTFASGGGSYQPLDPTLTALAALTTAADKLIYATGVDTFALTDLTAAGRAILDDADAAAQRTTLGLVIGTNVQAHTSALDAVTGTNTGDQTITLTGDVTGTGTGSFSTTIGATKVTSAMLNADVFSTAHTWAGAQTFVAPVLGTPASGIATNLTGTAAGLTAGHVTTNANLTGDVTSVGNAATIGATKVTSAMLNADVFSSIHTWSGVQTFSAAPVVPTQPPSDNSTKAASTAYVDAQVAGGVAGVASLNGQTGALVSFFPPQGRLTLASATPVMTTTQSAKTTLYYTPYVGCMIPIYDGTNMVPTTFSELSIATTDTAHSPTAIGASKVNDWFVWNDSGTLRLTHGPDWTDDVTRSATLVRVNGILLNNSSITNGPAASRGTYVGTTRSNASSQLNWIFGGTGTAAVFGVWNMYNRKQVTTNVSDPTSSWATASSATFATLNGSTTNRISAVFGQPEDGVDVSIGALMLAGTGVSNFVRVGFVIDSTTAADYAAQVSGTAAGSVAKTVGFIRIAYSPQIGFHFWQAMQSGDGSAAGTIYGGTEALVASFAM